MKLTLKRKEKTLELINKYSKNFSVDVNQVFTKTREVLDAPRHQTEGRRTTAWKCYGVCWYKPKIIFINMRKLQNMQHLREVIVHEITHLRFQYLAHGEKFESIIQRGLAGEKFKPYQKRSK